MSAPDKIYDWLNSQLSIARHYGGCNIYGHQYQIDYADPMTPLVRMDIFKAEQKAKGKADKTLKQPQGALL